MNRKQKIIVSVVGITIVLLALLGLTYAYFLTRIQGNTNNKSISVTTANLELTYADGNGTITSDNIMPGTTLTDKEFTVTNNGNATVNNYAVYLEELVNELTRVDDMVYTLTCTSSKENKICKGVNETTFPKLAGIIVTNSIDVGETQTYKLTVTYKEMGVDQSDDMGKKVSARVQIYNLTDIVDVTGTVTNASAGDYVEMHSNPKTSMITTDNKYLIAAVEPGTHTLYVKDKEGTVKGSKEITIKKGNTASVSGTNITVTNDSQTVNVNIKAIASTLTIDIGETKDYMPFDEGTLASAIYTSAKTKRNGTTFSATPLTTPAQAVSGENEKTLSTAEDDYGTSYYYRGGVKDNYIEFNNMCWRIVRIKGDGSIKLILEDQYSTCAASNGNWSIPTTTGGTTKTGNFGYTEYAANTLTASDGTQNSSAKYLMNYLNGETNKDRSMATAFKNFQTGSLSNSIDKLKVGDWCLNDKVYASESDNTTPLTNQEILDKYVKDVTFYYDSYVRLYGKTTKEPTLKCNGTNMSKFADNTDMYVGTLTADEIVYAGGKIRTSNSNYYLIDGYNSSITMGFFSLSPGDFFSNEGGDCFFPFIVDKNGSVYDSHVGNGNAFRPSINLKSGIKITGGDGTKENPYEIAS